MKKRYSAISLLLALSMISGCSDPDDNKIDWDALYSAAAEFASSTSPTETSPEMTSTEETTTIAAETTTEALTTTAAPAEEVVCAVDMIGMSLAQFEEKYGKKLFYEHECYMMGGSGYIAADLFPYTIICQYGEADEMPKEENIVIGVIVGTGGMLTKDIRCGMTLDEMTAAAPDIEIKAVRNDDIYGMSPYAGHYAEIYANETLDIKALWNQNAPFDKLNELPCSSIEVKAAWEEPDRSGKLPDAAYINENDTVGAVGMIGRTLGEICSEYDIGLTYQYDYYGADETLEAYTPDQGLEVFPYELLAAYAEDPNNAVVKQVTVKPGGKLNSHIDCNMTTATAFTFKKKYDKM